jgi:hypothetical protein
MQDRPTHDELLAAVESFLDDQIVPNVKGAGGFHARVAANVVRIVRRELQHEEEHLRAEWSGLDTLLGPQDPPDDRGALRDSLRQRNIDLCDRIRGGDADSNPFRGQTLAHVRETVRHKLLVTDPRLLERSGRDLP